MADLGARFSTFWMRAGARGDPRPVWRTLSAAWNEPHRAYHTPVHLADCLDKLSLVSPPNPLAVEMALWWHDAVYDTRRHDNEERSADLAASVCAAAQLAFGDRVRALILVTRHDAVPHDADEEAVLDVDLAILGAPTQRFDAYEDEVRREYEWVPDDAFAAGRAGILRTFLERPRIYCTPVFFERFEGQARENLERALSRWSAPAN